MRLATTVLAVFIFTIAGHAQDVDFGAFGDPGSLLGPAPPAARGTSATPARGAATPAVPRDRLVRLRDALAKAEAPLTKEQEVELNKLLDAEIPTMVKTLQTHGQQMIAARGPAATPAPAVPAAPAGGSVPPAAGAARGVPPSARVPAEILDALEVEMRQMNDVLFGKVAASAALNRTQQSILSKMSRAQIRSRGGFDALRVAMEDAGSPFTEEQLPKVKAIFEEQKAARAAYVQQSQGTPDPATIKQLERDALTKVVGLLIPAQRTALLAMLRAQQ